MAFRFSSCSGCASISVLLQCFDASIGFPSLYALLCYAEMNHAKLQEHTWMLNSTLSFITLLFVHEANSAQSPHDAKGVSCRGSEAQHFRGNKSVTWLHTCSWWH